LDTKYDKLKKDKAKVSKELKKGFISINEYNELTSSVHEKILNDDNEEEGEGNFFVDEDLPVELKDVIIQKMRDEKLISKGMSDELT
jgi:hypothetical protein